ncbi:MAG: hypothetical protein ACM3P1_04175 [Candidatus Saccharibacteria bacterium]
MKKIMPAIALMVLAPLLAEVLPGATRFSSLFVLPIEVMVWGGGALLIRYAVRRWNLGWINMLLLALCLSIAEEFLIQQTSVAPMVLQIKGIEYARSFGINYVYLLWALIYESVFVVILPIHLAELLFIDRRQELWMGLKGIITVILFFFLGSFLAWYSWTQIARPKVFHVPAYNPSIHLVILAIALIAFFIFIALGPFRNKLNPFSIPSIGILPPWMTLVAGALWAVLLYGIVLLAFGILPTFPPVLAIAIGLLLASLALYLIPRWTVNKYWNSWHTFSLIFGIMLGSMMAGFIGFIGSAPIDLYFKILVNILAIILMIRLGRNVKQLVR